MLASAFSVASLSSHVSSAVLAFDSLHTEGVCWGMLSFCVPKGSEADGECWLVPASCGKQSRYRYLMYPSHVSMMYIVAAGTNSHLCEGI